MKTMKDTLIFIVIFFVAILLLLVACDKGQARVDDWEARTLRFGEGLR